MQNHFFTSLINNRIYGYLKAFILMSAAAIPTAGFGVYMYLYSKNEIAPLLILAVSVFFAVSSLTTGIYFIVYKKQYAAGKIPFMIVWLNNDLYNYKKILSICDSEYADGKTIYTSISGSRTLNRITILPSFIILTKPNLEFIPMKNIVWAYGSLSVVNYRVNGIRQKRKMYAVYIYFKGMTEGKKQRYINCTFVTVKNQSEAEAVLQALAKYPAIAIGKSPVLTKMYKNDQKRLSAFFRSYTRNKTGSP